MTGAAGAAGPAGAPGVTGATGAAGPAGAPGVTGATGAAGPQGAPGVTGATGAAGPAGAPGVTGATGAAGPQGAPGVTGATGPTGAEGPQGAVGPTGATGAVGPPGGAILVTPTVFRYFYVPPTAIGGGTVDIPANEFTNDNGNNPAIFDGVGPDSYSNIYINGMMQEGRLFTLQPNLLTLDLSQDTLLAGTPIIVENIRITAQAIP
ncbi:DUF4183 domain-containing protein [Paenibacillus senegalimassiliensis]|uniref:DUF4183 domain-containing protein n=1 Tax=Paenibacillus senegalimassiliensis TaxID=1737426 RepID=UPI00073E818B|nr:DUF4183 domain-containing protein [Paenibacillus senegalimassiliensis]